MGNQNFIFILKVIISFPATSYELSHVLQKKDLSIVHAMELVSDVKDRLPL
jgi:hypothetical protein